MDPETNARLAVLNDQIRDEKDPTKLLQFVLEVLYLYDEMDGQKRRVAFQRTAIPRSLNPNREA